jgi:transposase-like protein
MTDAEAHATFQRIRWADNGDEPYCPRCGCLDARKLATRPVWKCKGCSHQFSVTAGTIFADRKRPIRDYLLAIAIFANGAKGHSALQLSRDLGCQYKTAFVLSYKLRETIEAEQRKAKFSEATEKEIDGAYFGGHVKPKNEAAERVDRRFAEEQTGKRQVVVVMRERKGRTLCLSCSQGKRRHPGHPPAHPVRLNRSRGRSARLGYAACPLRYAPDQSFRRVQQRRRLHQSGRVVFLSTSPG